MLETFYDESIVKTICELMLTLSDGTILTPGRIGREAEVLDLPNPLSARQAR